MIVCHCAAISERDIHAAIDWMRAADPETLITAGKIYRVLGKQADCGTCLPLFLASMARSDSLPVQRAFVLPSDAQDREATD